MGFALAYGHCLSCGRTFSFNPMRVPSLRINGVREPVCELCMKRANAKRKEMGLPEHEILDGAYEPCDEAELAE